MNLPATFKDGLGREWNLVLGLTAESRIKEITGFDLDHLIPAVDPKTKIADPVETLAGLHRLMGNPRKFFDLFYAMVKPSADSQNLTLEQVQSGFDTEKAIEDMAVAVMGAIVNFIRRDPLRVWVIPVMMRTSEQISRTATQRVMSELDKPDFWKRLDEQLAKDANSPTAPAVQDTPVA